MKEDMRDTQSHMVRKYHPKSHFSLSKSYSKPVNREVICMVYIRTHLMIRDVYKLSFDRKKIIHTFIGGYSLFVNYNIVYLSTIPFFINSHFL